MPGQRNVPVLSSSGTLVYTDITDRKEKYVGNLESLFLRELVLQEKLCVFAHITNTKYGWLPKNHNFLAWNARN